MRDKQNKTKRGSEDLTFASLIEEVDKSRKRAKVFYIFSLVLVVLSVFSFLLFGPVNIPILSKLGGKIMGVSENSEVEELQEETAEVAEETEEIEEEQEQEQEVIQKEEEVVQKKTTPVVTKPSPQPAPEPEPSPEPMDPYAEFSCPYDTVLFYAEEYCDNLQKSAESSDYADYWFDSYLSCPVMDTACQERYLSNHEDWKERAENYYSEADKYRDLMLGCNFDPKELPPIEDKCYK